jgi:ABC-type sugar transport system ATPase subunit
MSPAGNSRAPTESGQVQAGCHSMTIVSMDRVSKRFGAVQALDAVSFSVAAGEIRALCGENGAGKSTLVKMLMGIVRPDGGGAEL